MASVSVAQAAERLGVSVPRIHQRIADGSLSAERIGSPWVVDERSILRVRERQRAGRPLSARSVWAMIAASEGERESLVPREARVSVRAREQLHRLLDPAVERPASEGAVRELAVSLRSVLRNRAVRRAFRAALPDVADLRADDRWSVLVDTSERGIASTVVEGYLGESDVEGVVKDYLLLDADVDASVIVHVIPDEQHPFPGSRLRLAADLAEHRGPREEARAAALLHELALEWQAARP